MLTKRIEIDMFCCDQSCVSHHEHPPTSQRKISNEGGQLFVDDVIFFEIILKSFNVFDWRKHTNRSGVQRQKAVNNRFCGLSAYVRLTFCNTFELLCRPISSHPRVSAPYRWLLWLCLWKRVLQAAHGELECQGQVVL